MKLITGNSGAKHVTGADDSALNAAIIGGGDYLLSNTDFTVTAAGANKVQLSKAEFCMQGKHFRCDGTDILTLQAGDQGMYRCDSIVAKYQRDFDGIETVTAVVKTGTPSATEAKKPSILTGDLYAGEAKHEMLLANVYIYENNIQSIDVVVKKMRSIAGIAGATYDVKGVNTTATIPIPSDKTVSIDKVTLDPGVWILYEGAAFSANGTGYREIYSNMVAAGAPQTPPTNFPRTAVKCDASKTIETCINETRPVIVRTRADVYLWARQTSGETINALPYIYAYQIGGV